MRLAAPQDLPASPQLAGSAAEAARWLFVLALVALGVWWFTASPAPPSPEASEPVEQPELAEAIAQARATADHFITALADPAASERRVKVRIGEGARIEHVWMIDVIHDDGVFVGVIDSVPRVVRGVEAGDDHEVKVAEISDWSFVRDGKLHGAYTLRVALEGQQGPEADAQRERLAPLPESK